MSREYVDSSEDTISQRTANLTAQLNRQMERQLERQMERMERLLATQRDEFNERFEAFRERRHSTSERDFNERERERGEERRHGHRRRHRREREHERNYDEESERENDRRGRHHRRDRDDRLEGVKVKVPKFQGKNDPEAYLEWEMKVEQIFQCHHYSEEKKVKIASLEFSDYALIWWDQLQKERRRNGMHPIDDWEEMRAIMRRRYVPSHYIREIHNKLQRLVQGSKSVDEYHKEMEVALLRANVQEEPEATMARFLHGLNHDIRDVVELHHYVELEELVHQAIKVEQQLKRKSTYKKYSSNYNSSWKDKSKREGASLFKEKEHKEASASKAISTKSSTFNVSPSSSHKSRNIKCFKCLGNGHIASQCPNKKTMVLRNGSGLLKVSHHHILLLLLHLVKVRVNVRPCHKRVICLWLEGCWEII